MSKNKSLFVVGAIALTGLGLQAAQPPQLATMAQPSTPSPVTPGAKQRHVITLKVSDLGQVLVTRGQCVVAGQVIGDRKAERQKLHAKRRQLEIALKKLQTNRPAPLPPEEPSYAVEEANIDAARSQLAYWDAIPVPAFHFADRTLIAYYEQDTIQKRQQIQANRLQAQTNLNGAIANLHTARATHQRSLDRHSAALDRHYEREERRQLDSLKIQDQLAELSTKLRETTTITSPYNGTVRTVKIVGQDGLDIQVEVKLVQGNCR